MKKWIKQALTRTLEVKGSRGTRQVEVQPSERLVYGIIFALASLTALTVIQVAHIFVLKEPNTEINSAITLLVGTILGVFFGKKA